MTTNHSTLIGALALAVLLAAAGCESAPSRWSAHTQDRIDDALSAAGADARAPAALPPEVSAALLPPVQAALPGEAAAPPEDRFDLVVNEAPVREVLMGLVEGTPYSMVIHPEVAGTVTLNLKGVTLDDAMSVLRDVYGYEYRRDGSRYLVLSPGLQTRLFRVNYLDLKRSGRSDTRVTSGELTQANSQNQSGTTSGTRGQDQEPNIRVKTQSESDFWAGLSATLTSLIGEEGGRRVVVNPQAGVVVVTAGPAELRLVDELLGVTHAALNRQVLLEAKIIEVELNDGFQSGINWSRIYTGRGDLNDTDYNVGQIGGGSVFSGNGTSSIAGRAPDTLDVSDPQAFLDSATSAFGGVFTLAVRSTNFAAFLELLRSQGDVRVLSSPRVATLNNQKAVIKVGADEFFITNISGSVATGDTATQPSPSISPLFSGIALDVTPQIDEAGNMNLHIHPTISDVVEKIKNFRLSGGEESVLPLPVSSTQESDSIVRTRSGQIIVIGGLMKEAAADDSAAVPLLGEVPVFGNIFKHKRISRIKRELVILLKPTAVDSPQVWTQALGESRDRIRSYGRPAWAKAAPESAQ